MILILNLGLNATYDGLWKPKFDISPEKRRKMITAIINFVMAEEGHDIDVIRKAMYYQVHIINS